MSYHTVRFEEIPLKAIRNLPCPDCGKKVRRQKTFTMTLNPFNKNPDGTVRNRTEILAALREKAADWEATPEACNPCHEKWLEGRPGWTAHREMRESVVDPWNKANPVGTKVTYWLGDPEDDGTASVTRSEAWLLSAGHVVVAVEGHVGGIPLTHVEGNIDGGPADA